jgi:hypothetical protein
MNENRISWQEANDAYLAAALAWLRLRLARLVRPAGDTDGNEPSPAATPKRTALGLWKRQRDLPAVETVLSHPERITEADVAAAAQQVAQAADVEPPPALLLLSRCFDMSPFEQNVLLLCAALELDPNVPALCARIQGDSMPYPTIALALELFDDPAWDVLSPERPLRYWRLIEISQRPGQPLTGSALRADARIVNYIKGLNHLDERLVPLLAPFDVADDDLSDLPPSQRATVDQIIRHLEQAVTNGRAPIVQLLGVDPFSKQLMAGHAAVRLGLQLHRLPADLLPAQPADLEALARLWQRERHLLPIALYLDANEVDVPGDGGTPASSPIASALQRFLAHGYGFVFVGTREIRPGLGLTTVSVEVDKPTPAEQQEAWAGALADRDSTSPALLAGQFNLNVAAIRQIAHLAAEEPHAASSGDGHIPHECLWDACLASTRPRMDLLAQRLDPKATWDDIVLSEEVEALLRQIAAQVGQRSTVYDRWGWRDKMNRGLGISALFAGDSGTGKTMAAEVLANELQLNLYRIDLSAVVSKYIGETEKNLRRLFDAAEDGGAILFFDEADALFGKRSEVKDSHDRYANIEINYLLQRMEAYRGLAILATNMKSALDDAFLRRLRFIVDFAFPGFQERRAIWEKVFPARTAIGELDYERLAAFNLAGGSIHNVALNSAFLAAHDGQLVTMGHLLTAVRTELRKLGRPVREADFCWRQEPAGVSV